MAGRRDERRCARLVAGARGAWLAVARDLGSPRSPASLLVAEDLPADGALAALGTVPQGPVALRAEHIGLFPGGTLFLGCVASETLLVEQRRVRAAVAPLATEPWPYYEADGWVPHLTLAMGVTPDQLAVAAPLVLERLPLEGVFDRGGIEDGTTGENWPAPTRGA